jgi:hypothetical protein
MSVSFVGFPARGGLAGDEPTIPVLFKRSAGFGLLELVLLLCVAAVLVTLMGRGLLYYEERAERAAVELLLEQMRKGLQIQMTELIFSNRQAQVAELEKTNPMKWLEVPPANFAGDYPAKPRPGKWYYEPQQHQIVYVPDNNAYLKAGEATLKELRFAVVVPMVSDPATGGKTPSGVGLKPLRPYQWF